MVMGRKLDLIVYFSVNTPTAFIIGTVVFIKEFSWEMGLAEYVFEGLAGTWKATGMGTLS
jgi:hypothetical protein